MSNRITWHLQLKLKDGKLEAFRSLVKEMSEATLANEPGALIYEWYLSADGGTCHLIESYADSAATMAHIGNFGAHFAERFLTCVDPSGLAVYGEPTPEVREALAGFGPVYLAEFDGFRR